ncbi:MAG: alanine acetyltransferase [Enterovirga sp.]|jgi:hypothetical protein|nr:alanine acetyltransferase [Enterovirga sp.]
MPIRLEGSCRCGAVRFAADSHTPQPYQLCYCTICRKTAGGGGFAINIMAREASLSVKGREALGIFRAEIAEEDGHCRRSEGQRHFCTRCGTALWLFDPRWPDLVHPHASAIDTDLPVPAERTHIMLRYKASWVEPEIRDIDETFDLYPEESIEDWHRARGLWID